jgi:hypothetical protein
MGYRNGQDCEGFSHNRKNGDQSMRKIKGTMSIRIMLIAALQLAITIGTTQGAVVYVGSLMEDSGSEISDWNVTGTAKSLDLNGDDIYGTSGYAWLNASDESGGNGVLYGLVEYAPSYTDGIAYAGTNAGISASYNAADDRRDVADTTYVNVGYAGPNYSETNGATTVQALFAYTMNRDMDVDETIRIGVVLDSFNDGSIIGADSLRIVAGGDSADATGLNRTSVIDMYFFDITGLTSGQTIEIWGAKNVDESNFGLNAITIGGVTFDPSKRLELRLSPSDELAMDLIAPATLSTGVVEAAFTYGPNDKNVEITAVSVIDQQHSGAFSVVGFSSPLELTAPWPATEALNIEFNVAGTGLAHGETSTGLVEVIWNEIGESSTFTNTVPVTARYVTRSEHYLEVLGNNNYETYNGMAIDFNTKTPDNGVVVEYDLPLAAGNQYVIEAISVVKSGSAQAGPYYMAVYDSVVDTVSTNWDMGELTFSGFRGVSMNAADANVSEGTDVTWTFSNLIVVADTVPMTPTAIDTTGGSGKLFFVLQDTPDDRTGMVATEHTMYVKRAGNEPDQYLASVMQGVTGWRDTRVPVYKAKLSGIPRLFLLQIASADGTLDFEWRSNELHTYTLEATPSLAFANWAVYNDGVTTYEDIPGSGTGSNTLTGVLANGAENFFRVTQEHGMTSYLPVKEPSFENYTYPGNGTMNAVWNPTPNGVYSIINEAFGGEDPHFPTDGAAHGNYFALMREVGTISQDLGSVNAGDALSVTFDVGRAYGQYDGGAGTETGVMTCTLNVGASSNMVTIDNSTFAADSWQTFTNTLVSTESGVLSIEFAYVSGKGPFLDHISAIERVEP